MLTPLIPALGAEAGGFMWVQGQPSLYREFQFRQGYIVLKDKYISNLKDDLFSIDKMEAQPPTPISFKLQREARKVLLCFCISFLRQNWLAIY